jgi:hypothetical protein
MKLLAVSATAALMLAACVPNSATYQLQQGRYTDYQDLSRDLAEKAVEKQSAPQEVKDKFATCIADYAIKGFTPAELTRLDQYARGTLALTKGELDDLDRASKDRENGTTLTADTLDRLDTTCPQDVPSFRQYLRFPL